VLIGRWKLGSTVRLSFTEMDQLVRVARAAMDVLVSVPPAVNPFLQDSPSTSVGPSDTSHHQRVLMVIHLRWLSTAVSTAGAMVSSALQTNQCLSHLSFHLYVSMFISL